MLTIPNKLGTVFQILGADPADRYRISINFDKFKYLPLGSQINIVGLDRYLCKQKPYADEERIPSCASGPVKSGAKT